MNVLTALFPSNYFPEIPNIVRTLNVDRQTGLLTVGRTGPRAQRELTKEIRKSETANNPFSFYE
ncbi:hypothetical protein J6590_022249 [Homalodisca vitripennis]|nr:hypothetical protein J6590_022249 [Homalodisca vitripennis]